MRLLHSFQGRNTFNTAPKLSTTLNTQLEMAPRGAPEWKGLLRCQSWDSSVRAWLQGLELGKKAGDRLLTMSNYFPLPEVHNPHQLPYCPEHLEVLTSNYNSLASLRSSSLLSVFGQTTLRGSVSILKVVCLVRRVLKTARQHAANLPSTYSPS